MPSVELNPVVSRIVFWQTLSAHTQDLMVALSDLNPNTEVISCAPPGPDGQRRLWEWDPVSLGNVRTLWTESAVEDGLIVRGDTSTIHIVSGTGKAPLVRSALKRMQQERVFPIILGEPRVFEGARGLLRYGDSLLREGWLTGNAAAVLAIGRHGPPWYALVGYPRAHIFPFAYFVPPLTKAPCSTRLHAVQSPENEFRIGFVGRFVRMKGVDLLVRALDLLEFDARLLMIGAGPLEERLRSLSAGRAHPVEFLGRLPHAELGAAIDALDCLVLPSRSMDDGWGVVVSEALMQGVPVVVSSRVGASVLLGDGGDGEVVQVLGVQELARAITSVRARGLAGPPYRLERAVRARATLDHTAGARYLTEIIQHTLGHSERPRPFPSGFIG